MDWGLRLGRVAVGWGLWTRASTHLARWATLPLQGGLVPGPGGGGWAGRGAGVRLFERVDPERLRLEPTRVLGSEQVAHVRYRVSGG